MNLILRAQLTIFFHQIIAFALKSLDFVDISQIYQRDLLKIFEFIIQSIKMITDAFKVSLFFSYFFILWISKRQQKGFNAELVGDFVTAGAIGVLRGGRLD